MRLDHIEHRIEQQQSCMEFISNALTNLMKVGHDRITKQRIEIRLEAVKEQWLRFVNNHEAINLALSRVDTGIRQSLEERTYFKDGLYSSTHECYLETIEQMTSLLERHTAQLARAPSEASSSLAPTPMPLSHATRLPRIDLPKFNGSLLDWLSFKGLFMSLVISNSTISSVEKLQYLKTSLVGTASHLLKNTDLTDDNFQKAWDAVISFYENRRLLVNSALQSLFSINKMTQESAVEMEQLYTSIMQVYRSLETLQRPVHQWDDILVFMAVQRLDSESVKAWEHHLGSSKEPPTWNSFREFLMTRMLSLQAFEHSQPGKSSQRMRSQSARSHVSNAADGDHNRGDSNTACPLCSDRHYIARCPDYQQKSTKQRRDVVVSKGLCFNCLGFHRIANCRSTKRCLKCGQRHHSSLHQADPAVPGTSTASSGSNPSRVVDSIQKQSYHAQKHSSITSTVLLATAQVKVIDGHGQILQARVLLDQGSEISLITERLVQRLHLPRQSSSISIFGVGAQKSNKTRGFVSLSVLPHFNSSSKIKLNAHVLPEVTSQLPAAQPQKTDWAHIKNLLLADPRFMEPGEIDIIIGAEIYGQLLEGSIIKGPAEAPVAQLTTLGWIISGPCNPVSINHQAPSYHCFIDQDLNKLLERFWQQEEVSSSFTKLLSTSEKQCEDHYATTHTRDETGRYVVRLPFKASPDQLGDSKTQSVAMLSRLQRKFESDPVYLRMYSAFLSEYISLRHMIQVPDERREPKHVFYLPHHGVIKESSSTTKLRVVFNGSCRPSEGSSLNDILHTGAKLQVDLFDVLIWFRQHKYIFSSDVEKMYRQIKVHPADWDFQRILWKEGHAINKYQLSTVTYGLACAPFLALRTLLQLVRDEGHKFPLAIDALTKGRYVDDVFGGAQTIEEAQQTAYQVDQLCMAGGFPLRKWISNHPDILQLIPPEHRTSPTSVEIKDTVVQALGLLWNPSLDRLHFHFASSVPTSITKRVVLSRIAQFFDPLGLLSPIFIQFKIFMQELWHLKLQWDTQLASPQLNTWHQLTKLLDGLEELHIPRWIGLKSQTKIELHGFSDASQLAMAASIYLKTTSSSTDVNVSLLCSKTKVAPLKRMTIPRLELSAAVMLTKLISHCQKVMNIDEAPCYLWTDSSIVCTWLNNHPSKWKEFVHNRVCMIQETLPHARWNHISGALNPADCATRGLSAPELENHSIWWKGPSWLVDCSSNWPISLPQSSSDQELEQRPTSNPVVLHATTSFKCWELLTRYSSLTRLIRITAICLRMSQLLLKKSHTSLRSPLTPNDLNEAIKFWTRHTQQESFHREINSLVNNQDLPKSNPLVRLRPFIDGNHLLRVGGRLQNSSLIFTAKHPCILPKKSILTTLIIRNAHYQTLHGSTQETLNYIRNDYWIVGGRAPVRSFILKCITCTRYRRVQAQQVMGQLPACRVNPSRPFLHSGVAYAGPFTLKTWRGRAARTYKSWIALFVCYATSAVHLEIVTSYTTDAFLAAYKRFIARRGICATLRSDCGTNFKGADHELKQLFSHSSAELFASLIANDGTEWKFNPPAAPHFGGKFEAGIKSMKFHLRRVVGETRLTYEEMSTILTQIEAILNSRPLCPLTEDPDDLSSLTPGHFLIGQPLTLIPEPNLEPLPTKRLCLWQHLSQMVQSFWRRWSKEYLQRHQAVYKWNQTAKPIRIGDLVLIIDERYPPAKWPLGRVLETYPGSDNIVRVVSIKTSSTIIKRPIVKLCPLPIEPTSSIDSSPGSTKAGGNVK